MSWGNPSWAWVLEGHREIAIDAVGVLPALMREAFLSHLSSVLSGVVEPDINRVDDHELHIISLKGSRAPRPGGAAEAFKRFAAKAEDLLRSGRGLDEVLFVLGQATHFVEDLNQPLHSAWGETAAEHHDVEGQMLYRGWHGEHTYRGFMLVKKYGCFAYEIATASSVHANALFFNRDIKRVTKIAWDQAVNDTANFWQSVFWHALGPERALELYGITPPLREIGKGFLC